jgi:hypothetical protein
MVIISTVPMIVVFSAALTIIVISPVVLMAMTVVMANYAAKNHPSRAIKRIENSLCVCDEPSRAGGMGAPELSVHLVLERL